MSHDLTDLLSMEKQGRYREALQGAQELQAKSFNFPARKLNLDLLTQRLQIKIARSHFVEGEKGHNKRLLVDGAKLVSDESRQSACILEAEEQVRQGNFCRAVCVLSAGLRNSAQATLRPVLEASIQRVLEECESRAAYRSLSVDVIHENSRNPNTANIDVREPELLPIVSLTTISSRIDRVVQTVHTIANQSLRPHSINLYISEDPYLIDKGISRDNENLLKIIDAGVNVYMTTNIGPYRKQYPVIKQLKKRGVGLQTLIVTLDDDVLYPPYVLERLVDASRRADAVIAYRGRQMAYDNGMVASYRKFEVPSSVISHLNLGTGKNGIAYRLKHFPSDPGEYVGPELAPTADDIWCKWVTSIKCIPTMILEPRSAYDAKLDFPETAPTDKNGLFHVFNNKGTNDEAMLNMEDFFMYKRGVNLSALYGRGSQ